MAGVVAAACAASPARAPEPVRVDERPAVAAPESSRRPPEPEPECPIEREALEKRLSNLRVSAECMRVIARAPDLSFFESASIDQHDASTPLDLSPLSRATGLTSVTLSFRTPPDLTPLADLPKLGSVWIRNQLETLNVLAPLVRIRRVHVQPTSIGEIRDLSALRKLGRLEGFFTNQLYDLEALATAAPELVALDAWGAKNLIAFARFQKLEHIELGCMEPGDRPPEPPRLRSLRLSCHDAEPALGALAAFPNLRELDISETGARSLASLAKLGKLERLDVHGTQIQSLAPLAGLRELSWLDIHNTNVASVAPLAGLPKLAFLDAGGSPIASVAPLARSRSLAELHLPATRVRSVLPLAGVRSLAELMVPKSCDAPDVLALHRARPDIRLMMWLDKAEPEDPTCFR